MSFVGQDLVTHRNNSYAGCLSWPENHPPELDNMWKLGKSMDVVSMISGIICVFWILTFACFRWAKCFRYILMTLFIFTGCAAGLALLAFKSKLCHQNPYHCNIVPAAVISGCAALNWFVCAFIIWHLQDPDDRDPDFDDEDEEDDDDDDDRVKKRGHRKQPEVIVEDLPDGSRKITKIKKRSDGSEKVTETIIPAEELNYQQEHMKPYPETETESMLQQEHNEDDAVDEEEESPAPRVEAFQDEYLDGDDGFRSGFKPEYYPVPVQPNPDQTAVGSREIKEVEPEPEPEPQEQETPLMLLPMEDDADDDDYHQQTSHLAPSQPFPDLLDDQYRAAVVKEQPDHSAVATSVAAPQHPDLLDQHLNYLHGGYVTGDDDNESRDAMFHDDDDEDVADLLDSANQNRAPSPNKQPQLPQLTTPDDFRLKADDYEGGIPLDPPTDPHLLPPPPRLDPPMHYHHDDDDEEEVGHVPEIV